MQFTYRNDATVSSVAGVLLVDEPRELRIFDLQTLQERSFNRDGIRMLKIPATEQDVASLIGLVPVTSSFIAQYVGCRGTSRLPASDRVDRESSFGRHPNRSTPAMNGRMQLQSIRQ